MSWQLCRARGRVRFCACEAVLCCRTWWLQIVKFDLPKSTREWAHLAHLRFRDARTFRCSCRTVSVRESRSMPYNAQNRRIRTATALASEFNFAGEISGASNSEGQAAGQRAFVGCVSIRRSRGEHSREFAGRV